MYSYSFYVVAIGCLKVKCVRVFTPVVSVPCGAELVKILFRKSPFTRAYSQAKFSHAAPTKK